MTGLRFGDLRVREVSGYGWGVEPKLYTLPRTCQMAPNDDKAH